MLRKIPMFADAHISILGYLWWERLFSNILIFEMKNEMFDDSLAFSQPAIAVINGPSRPRFLC